MCSELERLRAFNDCAVYVHVKVHTWSEMQDSPLIALAIGIGSCAATAAIATEYLAIHEIPTQFAYTWMHGDIHSSTGEAIVGHAIAFSPVVHGGTVRVFESVNDARCRVRNVPIEQINLRYRVGPPQEMLDEYHATITGEPADSLEEVREIIQSQIGARAVRL